MKDRAFFLCIAVVYLLHTCERRIRMVKRYEELTISDDFMFGKTMGDKVLCQDVLEQLHDRGKGSDTAC